MDMNEDRNDEASPPNWYQKEAIEYFGLILDTLRLILEEVKKPSGTTV